MNNYLFIALIIVLLYYFLYYLPRQKTSLLPPKNKPLTSTISTQTNLSDKQISLLTQQWNQVANWAQEEGIDTNKSWNLTLLKNKIKQELETAKKKPTTASKGTSPPLTLNYSRSTQTDTDSDLENTLDSLIQSMHDLNKEIK